MIYGTIDRESQSKWRSLRYFGFRMLEGVVCKIVVIVMTAIKIEFIVDIVLPVTKSRGLYEAFFLTR